MLERYRRLRAIGREQHTAMMKLISGPAMLKQARRLGLAQGKTLVLDSLDDMNFVWDILFYTSSIDRSRVVDRYARSVRLEPGSDEEIVREAKRQSRFAIIKCKEKHPIAGLIVTDLVRGGEYHLIDEGLEVSLPAGALIATRLIFIDDWAMTAGVMVPLDADFLKCFFASAPLFQRKPAKALIDDRRFAEALYRAAVMEGITERIAYRNPDEDPHDALMQKGNGRRGLAA